MTSGKALAVTHKPCSHSEVPHQREVGEALPAPPYGGHPSLSHTRWEYKYHVVFIPKGQRKRVYQYLRLHRPHLGEVLRARAALAQEKLAPVLTAYVKLPMDFRAIRGISMVRRRGETKKQAFQKLAAIVILNNKCTF